MYKIFSKIFLSLTFVLTGFLFFSVDKVEAACVVDQANFRTTPNQIPADGWYTDVDPPYVYIDFQTTGCTTTGFIFSVTQSNYSLLGAAYNDANVTNITNYPIQPAPVDDFTIALRAGDQRCSTSLFGNETNCRFYIRINYAQMGLPINNVSSLRYNCDSGCDNKNWEVIGILQTYQGTHLDDVEDPVEPSDTNPGISTGGQSYDINIQNPIGENTMTLVDFIDKVIKFALTIGIPIIAIAIIYSGLLFVTARGNDKQLETAKNAFTYAVIGGAILLGSWIFAKLIKETIESIVMIITYYG